VTATLTPEIAREVKRDVDLLLAKHSPEAGSEVPLEVQRAVFLARHLQTRANALQTPAERRQQAELDRMIQSPRDKATLVQMTDQAFRSRLPHRAADQLIHILDVQGIPRFFSSLDRTLLRGFQSFGAFLPGVAMPFVKEKMQHETANVVLPAEEELLRDYLRERRAAGLRMNVNYLGEAVLSEREAQRRLEIYLAALADPQIEVVSVKISTIYSQVSPLSREHTVEVLSDRLELLYRASAKHRFERRDGSQVPKFVYLDMEEYRDKQITAEAFMRTLDRPGLRGVSAGMALQAYLPDSFETQQAVTQWAHRRVASGGGAVVLRLVKGANLEMERVEASLRGWPQAPFLVKEDTDTNFHRMMQYGMQPEHLAVVRLGIASHNLFALAYALVLAARDDTFDRIQLEMLEGMANHQRRAVFELSRNLLLYAPACRQQDFVNAIGYLVRRLDENTGAENFLRHAFCLEVGSQDWQELQRAFVASFDRLDKLPSEPRRTQDRRQEAAGADHLRSTSATAVPVDPLARFENAPDTDWSLPHHGDWVQEILQRWQPRCDQHAAEVPLVVDGEEIAEGREQAVSSDPSRPELVVARHQLAHSDDVERAVRCAQRDPEKWRTRPSRDRAHVLGRVADGLASARGDLLGVMLAEGGKTIAEGDPEVSEAIDFCRFYPAAAEQLQTLPGLEPRGRGVVAVVSPWNFPLAIPCGGVAAALAAGNCVILKPASDTVLTAYLLCECFWQAGVPRTALQLVPCDGATVGQDLVTHPGVDVVILTGGTRTALRMLQARPEMNLLAETGGKNATIVTALADRDLAIKNVLHSAFSHSGQKCSATSLLILEDEVYRDREFRAALCEAIESLQVGSAWQLPTRIGPLIRPPSGVLECALKELETGEAWAVMPRLHVDGNPHLVSPGVKWGVQPGSVNHGTEFFGPLLGVMRARDLHEAIDLVNATGYGLTSGLESLDDREHRLWKEGIRAGNLYINRSTTGAIVYRQPFGGMGNSAVGPGIKAGGPNYVIPLADFSHTPRDASESHRGQRQTAPDRRGQDPEGALQAIGLGLAAAVDRGDCERRSAREVEAAAQSYAFWMDREFSIDHDPFELLGEDNIRRYLPFREIRVRVHPADSLFDLFARAVAARTAGCRTVISVLPGSDSKLVALLDELTDDWAGAIEFVEQSDAELAEAVRSGKVDCLRYAQRDRVPREVRAAAASCGEYVADAPVSSHGRVELVWYFQEQTLSHIYHRYGNLGVRSAQA
jgi:RHH-type proline utilization regulon transcriptional repressor/proline dehydrogenase/delta 1-pyrroline-5-carboxylate dehydrogenase